MSHDDSSLDARLRRLFAGIDTRADFGARVMARVAARAAAGTADREAELQREWALARQRLRRESWTNAATVGGVAAAAGALFWRYAPAIAQWTEAGGASALDPWHVSAIVAAAMIAALWPLRERLTGAV